MYNTGSTLKCRNAIKNFKHLFLEIIDEIRYHEILINFCLRPCNLRINVKVYEPPEQNVKIRDTLFLIHLSSTISFIKPFIHN